MENQDYYLNLAASSVKVEIQDLLKLFERLEADRDSSGDPDAGKNRTRESDFVVYFKTKYLEMTSLRLQEKEAYEIYKKVKQIAKREEYQQIKEYENAYNRIRNERIQLQKILDERRAEFYLY